MDRGLFAWIETDLAGHIHVVGSSSPIFVLVRLTSLAYCAGPGFSIPRSLGEPVDKLVLSHFHAIVLPVRVRIVVTDVITAGPTVS